MAVYRVLAVLVLVALGLPPAWAAPAPARAAAGGDGAWFSAPPPPDSVVRGEAFAGPVALGDGQVLFVARRYEAADTVPGFVAVRFDPATNAWHPAAAPPVEGRPGGAAIGYHRFVPLAGGGVLLLISVAEFASPPLAFVYEPGADRWRAVASPGQPQTGSFGGGDLGLVPLPDGRALATGLFVRGNAADRVTPWAEVYDPAAGRWTVVDPPREARQNYVAASLPGGQVLIAGGRVGFTPYAAASATAERFDPATGRWTPAAALAAPPTGPALRLADGAVLAVNGDGTTERYDPVTDRWRAAATNPPPVERGLYNPWTATLLADGRVFVAGGRVDRNEPGCTQKCDRFAGHTGVALYDPAADRWSPGPPMGAPRLGIVAAPLPGGRVLVVGNDASGFAPPESAEVYAPDAPSHCFPETGFCLRGRFLDYWLAHGGLARNGYPLSAERREVLEDGREYAVQYFERVRLEYHPEHAPPFDVLLGQFGRRTLRTQASAPPLALVPTTPRHGAAFFPETEHNLEGAFLAYWQANGGLAQFGFPLSERFMETLEDGQEYEVQYFERARFEHHPENAPPYDLLLGQFGRRILAENALLAGAPGFKQLYVTNERVQTVLGVPKSPAVAAPGATLAFERGRMVWRGDTRWITVFCGGEQAGAIVWDFADTWEAGRDPGGGPAPGPGRYLPRRGFGKLWREEAEVRDCLGYALTPDETSYALQVQDFAHRHFGSGNRMLAVVVPEGRFIYVIFDTYLGGSSCISRPDLCVPDYERFQEPIH